MPAPETMTRKAHEPARPVPGQKTVPWWLTLYLVFAGVGTMGYGIQMVLGMSNFIVGTG